MSFLSGLTNALAPLASAMNPVGAIVGGIDAVSGLFGQSSDQRFNREQMQAQQQFSSAEAAKQRQWQSEQWERQFNMTNEYNSPQAQAARMSEAGLNPWSQAGQAYSSNSTSNGGTIGTGANAVAPASAQDNSLGFTGRWRDLSEASKAIADADNVGIDTEFLRSTLEARIKNESARAAVQQVIADNQEEMTKKELRKLDKVIRNIQALSDKYDSEATLNDMKSWTEERIWNKLNADIQVALSQVGLNNELTRQLKELLDAGWATATVKNIKSQTVSNYASASASYANASLARAQAETENLLRSDNAKLLKMRAIGEECSAKIASAANEEQKKAAVLEAIEQQRRAGIITDRLAAELKTAQAESRNADGYYFIRNMYMASKTMEATTKSASNIMDVYKPF